MSFIKKISKELKKPEREFRRIRDTIKNHFKESSDEDDDAQPEKVGELPIPLETSHDEVETRVMDEEPIIDQKVDKNNKDIEDFVSRLANCKGWSREEDVNGVNKYDITLTKFNQEYDEFEADIRKYIDEEMLIGDEPSPVPKPDFTGLQPHADKLDYEFQDDIFDHFDINWDENESKEKPNHEDTANININHDIVQENVIQEPGDTDDYYSTKSKRRGLALLMINNCLVKGSNNYKYESKINQLSALLANVLEFKVERHDILYRDKAEDVLKKVNDHEEADGDCLMIVILTRGHRDKSGREKIRFGNDTVETCDLWRCVDGNNCPNLAKKPKIFIQIAWPELEEINGKMSSDSGMTTACSSFPNDSPEPFFKIPNMTHFFIVSAIPQVGDDLDLQMVDCFLDKMIDVLRTHSSDLGWDLNKIMTEVNSRVYQSFYPRKIKQGINKYVRSPNFTSSLTKYFIFKPKSR